MARFKTAMAFPMFATVVWLVWVLGQQVGIDGVTALLGLLVAAAFAVWVFGAPGPGGPRRLAWMGAAGVLVFAVSVWAWPSLHNVQATEVSEQAATSSGWQTWSPEAVDRARQAGRPVFVDFTAAWCVSCQVNKKLVLDRGPVVEAMRSADVLRLNADWTNRAPRITAELARHGRNGVPLYLVYLPRVEQPVVLPELLTNGIVLDALAGLDRKG